jgi:phosphatidylserine/phosphatidylglycerophosphate/cardiolipin synthase-like enzyme
METIDQQVINDNREIYAKIQSELWKAEFEILIATAWFTDDDLFNILLDRLAAGIHIEVIIADNQENEKLNFNLLQAKGASVYRIKGQGYGGMNQKFCVIDKQLALHGSYNWSMNAKKNNQESIISTDHKDTVLSLIKTFNDTKTGSCQPNRMQKR